MKPSNCPIGPEVDRAIELGREFSEVFTKLRRSLNDCGKCESEKNCPIIQRFQVMIGEIIIEINSEWNIPI